MGKYRNGSSREVVRSRTNNEQRSPQTLGKPPSDADLQSTGVLRVDIASASGPGVEHVDVQDKERVWSGVVPTWLVYGNPIALQHNEVAEGLEYIRGWTTQENE